MFDPNTPEFFETPPDHGIRPPFILDYGKELRRAYFDMDILPELQEGGTVKAQALFSDLSSGVTSFHDEFKVHGPGIVIVRRRQRADHRLNRYHRLPRQSKSPRAEHGDGPKRSLGEAHYVANDFWPLNTALWIKEFKRVTPLKPRAVRDLLLPRLMSGGITV